MSGVILCFFLLPPAAQLWRSGNNFVLTMHENIAAFSTMLRWFVAFSSPDYQRMKSSDGQNRLIISSHTSVSATFSLFSSKQFLLHMYRIQKHSVHQENKKKISLSALSFDSIFQHQSIFLSLISSYVTNSVLNES